MELAEIVGDSLARAVTHDPWSVAAQAVRKAHPAYGCFALRRTIARQVEAAFWGPEVTVVSMGEQVHEFR